MTRCPLSFASYRWGTPTPNRRLLHFPVAVLYLCHRTAARSLEEHYATTNLACRFAVSLACWWAHHCTDSEIPLYSSNSRFWVCDLPTFCVNRCATVVFRQEWSLKLFLPLLLFVGIEADALESLHFCTKLSPAPLHLLLAAVHHQSSCQIEVRSFMCVVV
jgi:hypothetical protein